ncbi:ParB/RepB/Spo0J family partition protein [Candidatus Woesebacteria bacterium]|nr:ParB/RepB/Spo0J family partition protein [Candidatus Woesebacteria bacterium]
MVQTVQLLAVNLLQPNPFQPRNKIMKDELDELADSIKKHGILEPLVVAHTPAGYQIIAGERRWRAAQLAGLTEVPAIIKKTSPKGMLEMALIENVQRINLSALERAQAFQQLMREFGYSVNEIADRISKSGPYISNSLKLLQLPDAIKDGLLGRLITEGHARAIAGIADTKTMVEVYKQILKENASVRRAEELARLTKQRLGQVAVRPIQPKQLFQVTDPAVALWEERLKKLLRAKSNVKLSRTYKQTQIVITIKGDPEETQRDLETLMKLVGQQKQ